MRVTPRSVRRFLIPALVVGLAFSPPPLHACGKAYTEAELSNTVYEMAQKVDLLWTGTDDERLWIAEDAWPHFRVFDMEEAAEDEAGLAAVVSSLRLFVQIEPDDWVLRGVLGGLLGIENPLVNRVFADALEHPSTNVREIAVHRFVDTRDPAVTKALETMWTEETRSAIRVNTMLALACQGSERHLRAFAAMLDSPNSEWVVAAIEALSHLRPGSGEAALLRAARDEDPLVRTAALEALRAFPDSLPAREALLRGLRDADDDVRYASIASLDGISGHDVFLALEDAVMDDDWRVRNVAFHRLLENDGRASSEELIGRLRADERFSEEFVDVWRMDRWDTTLDRGAGCFLWAREDPELPERVALRAPGGSDSVRCYERPGVPAEPEWTDRLREGSTFWVEKAFEHDGERWLETGVCWYPEGLLEEVVETDSILMDPSIVEFDLRLEDLDDPQVAGLLDAGLLELFDEAAEVVGVRVTADAADTAQLELVVRAWERSDGLFGVQLAPWLRTMAVLHGDHPAWKRIGDIDARAEERSGAFFENLDERLPRYRRGP